MVERWVLVEREIVGLMSPMDSFFSRFKVELIYAEQYESIEEANSGIFEYIEIFYNL